jgi:hypothetical protein
VTFTVLDTVLSPDGLLIERTYTGPYGPIRARVAGGSVNTVTVDRLNRDGAWDNLVSRPVAPTTLATEIAGNGSSGPAMDAVTFAAALLANARVNATHIR